MVSACGALCGHKNQIPGGEIYLGGSAAAAHVPNGEIWAQTKEFSFGHLQTMWPSESVLAPEVRPKSPTECFACV